MSRKILMILTSHARMGDTGQATGVWAEELDEAAARSDNPAIRGDPVRCWCMPQW